MPDNDNNTVGEPGLGESLIPVWGAGRESVNHFQHHNYVRGVLWGALAVSDIFLVKALAVGGARLVGKAATSLFVRESKVLAVKGTLSIAKATPNASGVAMRSASNMSHKAGTFGSGASKVIDNQIPGIFHENIAKITATAKEMAKRAAQGPWRATGNTAKMVKNPAVKYKAANIFWDPRPFSAVSRQYWRVSKGANGNSLQHLWVMNGTRWVPQGLRNSGLNLLEIPKGLNSWMAGIPAREWTFRAGVFSILTTTLIASYLSTSFVLDTVSGHDDKPAEARISSDVDNSSKPLP